MGLHLAIASPLDARRLARELDLRPRSGTTIPDGHGGHPVTELVLAVRPMVELLDLVTLDPALREGAELVGDGVRLAVGPFRPRARTRSLDLFAEERRFVAHQLRRWRPDVVNAHWTYEYALAALESGAPTLVTVHDWAPTVLRYTPDRYRAIRLLMQRLTLRRGSDFAAVSPYVAARVEKRIGRPVVVLPNFLGRGWFGPQGVSDRGPAAATAINNGFGALKNVQTLLRAWPIVRARLPQATLRLVGQGYEPGGDAQRWATRHSLGTNVEFLGPVPRPDLQPLVRGTSVFVHPSREESFGMVVLEAMATGTPVVGGKRSGAVPWLLEDGAGMCVDIDSPEEIAGAVLGLLEDPATATELGHRGRSRALREFAAEPVAAAYLERLRGVGSPV
jgi:L-malate glycosyltransferase